MDRPTLAALLVVGKGLDTVGTIVALRSSANVRETVPLAIWLMAQFGVELGMVILWGLAVVAVALVAEAGVVVRHYFPAAVPAWYPDRLRTVVYLSGAVWFGAIGLRAFWLVA